MGKALTGELSCPCDRSCYFWRNWKLNLMILYCYAHIRPVHIREVHVRLAYKTCTSFEIIGSITIPEKDL